eukprot:2162881-Prymnesium_polylepis.1
MAQPRSSVGPPAWAASEAHQKSRDAPIRDLWVGLGLGSVSSVGPPASGSARRRGHGRPRCAGRRQGVRADARASRSEASSFSKLGFKHACGFKQFVVPLPGGFRRVRVTSISDPYLSG